MQRLWRWSLGVFAQPATFVFALLPFGLLSLLLFTRNPQHTNFIYDEQEALLANPYVRSITDAPGTVLWRHAFSVDFWGRPPEGTIGSYRPIPNLIWRAIWWLSVKLRTLGGGSADSPFLCHWLNVLLHGVVSAALAAALYRITRSARVAWAAGMFFCCAAISTEAVSGVVGLADVLCGLSVLLAVIALALPMHVMPMAVFLACLLGLFSKETAIVTVALVPLSAWVTARVLHPRAPRGTARALVAGLSSVAALVFYVEVRKRLFKVPTPAALSPESLAEQGPLAQLSGTFLRWFSQPITPHDTINNPLVGLETPLRIAGALRVYARGLGQTLLPLRLAGDYSYPQEPAPTHRFELESVLGLALMALPVLLGAALVVWALLRAWRAKRPAPLSRAALWGLALLWVVIAFFPVSNIPVVLPTVRAERFWYVPLMGVATLVGLCWSSLWRRTSPGGVVRGAGIGAFVVLYGIQMVQARSHANDYLDDLAFWDATRKNATRSAKAHLNYSVMQGARKRPDERLAANAVALALSPDWAMANVYMGDALCRSGRTAEALPYYQHGFSLGPNEVGLLSLGLQCLWDQKQLAAEDPSWRWLEADASAAPGSWYAYLVSDVRANGEQNGGVDPKYRPRGYNEGPKDKH